MPYYCGLSDCCEGCAIASQTCTGMRCLFLFTCRQGKILILSRKHVSPRKQIRSNSQMQVNFQINSMLLGLLSDTSQSTYDRTRYVCTPWLSLPMSTHDTVRGAASLGTQSVVHAATPGTCGCRQPSCHPTAVFESLRIIFLLHCHGRAVLQQRVLSPLSSSIKPGRDIPAARWLLRRCIEHSRLRRVGSWSRARDACDSPD